MAAGEEIFVEIERGKALVVRYPALRRDRREGQGHACSSSSTASRARIKVPDRVDDGARRQARRKAEAGQRRPCRRADAGRCLDAWRSAAGQAVKAGDVLLSIEAMKMETALHAEARRYRRRGAGERRRPDRRKGPPDRFWLKAVHRRPIEAAFRNAQPLKEDLCPSGPRVAMLACGVVAIFQPRRAASARCRQSSSDRPVIAATMSYAISHRRSRRCSRHCRDLPGVRSCTASPPMRSSRRRWMRRAQPAFRRSRRAGITLYRLAVDMGGTVLGYAYASVFRTRPAHLRTRGLTLLAPEARAAASAGHCSPN